MAQEAQAPLNFEVVVPRQASANRGPRNNFRDFNEVTQGAEKIEGLFNLYLTGDHLYMEIRPDQYNQPLLTPTTIARGMAQAGIPVGDDERVLVLRRVGDRVQIVRRNIFFKAPAGSPLEKAVKQNYTDSILMAVPIVTQNPMRGNAALIDLTEVFMSDFANVGLGMPDRSRSHWTKAKGFPGNVELELEATYGGGFRSRMSGGGEVADPRGVTLVLHFSVIKANEMGYRPRAADDRVGHFLNATKDFGVTSPDSNFVRYINRWRLEKSDPRAKLSPPKKQIIWYVEDTVPLEYRPYVEEGISEWNKAFEKIGFKNAIAVRWQESDRDVFDPEDTNYCTFRWITSDTSYAMSCLRSNPITGEMIDGDVVFDASFVRYWKENYALLIGSTAAAGGDPHVTPLAFGEVISPILASKMGFGQPGGGRLPGVAALDAKPGQMVGDVVPAEQNFLQWQLASKNAFSRRGLCQLQTGFQNDLGFAAVALADPPKPSAPPIEKDKDKDKDKDKAAKKPETKPELPEEFLAQAIKYITMHEVGHSLGLRHNFKASTMLNEDQLHDTNLTHARGLVGSVMDYCPVNIAPKGKKQGDYYPTTLGPYDYWAIEYAYKPADGDEASELKKIASRAPEHDLVYATDEDAALNDDPYVNRWDMGSDPCAYGRDRIQLASDLLKDLDARVVKDGESWARTRKAFGILLSQWGDGATLASQFIGGQSVSRDHKADKDARDPIVPVSGAKQRECLKFLSDNVLSDKAFQFSPALLRRLGVERWMHWGDENGYGPAVDISVFERILGIQKIVLAHCLSGGVLARIQNQQLQADAGSDPLRMEEVFRSLTEGIWSDIDKVPDPKDAKAPKVVLSTVRRNLQREHLRRLSNMVLGDRPGSASDSYTFVVFLSGGGRNVPADARALARLHLREVGQKIGTVMDTKAGSLDDTSKAHLEECRHRIAKVLEANLDIKEP
ncbi:zinc-dependent metalloprotease [Aquisphaera giovannonii]|nr:zinc-dependent metalloprotease [Aquisphaera giovannonii]